MTEKPKLYLKLEQFSPLHRFYVYWDCAAYQADVLFLKHQVLVRFLQEYVKDGWTYRAVFCRVRKRDEAAFLKSLGELPSKMLLCGHPDYLEQCGQFME